MDTTPDQGHATLVFNAENFQKEVLESSRPVLVDFTAAWCAPCQRLAPVIEELAVKYAGRVRVGKVDLDSNQDLATKYDVTSVPTIVVFKNGEIAETIRGYNPEHVFSSALDSLLEG